MHQTGSGNAWCGDVFVRVSQLEEVVRVGPGEAQFVELIEKLTGRDLTIRKSGRPLKHGS
jgi:hypothetical protein